MDEAEVGLDGGRECVGPFAGRLRNPKGTGTLVGVDFSRDRMAPAKDYVLATDLEFDGARGAVGSVEFRFGLAFGNAFPDMVNAERAQCVRWGSQGMGNREDGAEKGDFGLG